MSTHAPTHESTDSPTHPSTHHFLLASARADEGHSQTVDQIGLVADLRAGIDALPQTVTTFKLDRVLTDHGARAVHNPQLVELTGAWQLPDWWAGTGKTASVWVNPHSPDAHIHSDVFVTCDCGATITTVDICTDESKLSAVGTTTEHTDDCKRIWRWRARAELIENRREMIDHLLWLGLDSSEIGPRLGYAQPNVADEINHHDIDLRAARDDARERIARTAAAWLDRKSPAEIADAYGYSVNGLKRLIRTHTDADMEAAYAERLIRGDGDA